MDTTILNTLKDNKITPCISVIIPMHNTLPDQSVNKMVVNKMLKKAKELILHKFGEENLTIELLNKLETLSQKVDYTHLHKGIGLFVSPGINYLIQFPFHVNEKIVVGDSFEIRDLLYLKQISINYYVLLINEKEVNLFKGNRETLTMIKDENFPLHFVDDYEYAHPALGSSYGYSLKSTEKDKSIIQEERLTTYLKHADQKLSTYLSVKTPLIIIGNSKELGYFKKISVNYKNVVGKINGTYAHENTRNLRELSYQKIQEYLNTEADKMLEELNNAIGKKLVVSGIKDVWKTAKEGKGHILLVEQDFTCPGFITQDDSMLFTHPPKGKHNIITDTVDDVIETALKKQSKIVIMEKGKLNQFQKIAMILRYS